MANKFFSYSFQVHRTRKTGIVFIIFVIVLLGGSFIWYKMKNNVTTVEKLNYKVVFGMNEFEDNSCDKAYRVNYKKNTCGTFCVKAIGIDDDYIKKTKNEMEKNGFTISKNQKEKINSKKWSHIKTTNDGPIIHYYVTNYNKKTYVVEFIDQSSYHSKEIQSSCNKTFNTMLDSLKLK